MMQVDIDKTAEEQLRSMLSSGKSSAKSAAIELVSSMQRMADRGM